MKKQLMILAMAFLGFNCHAVEHKCFIGDNDKKIESRVSKRQLREAGYVLMEFPIIRRGLNLVEEQHRKYNRNGVQVWMNDGTNQLKTIPAMVAFLNDDGGKYPDIPNKVTEIAFGYLSTLDLDSALKAIKKCRYLSCLLIRNSEISYESGKILSDIIKSNPELQSITINTNSMTQKTFKLIFKATLGHPHVSYFEIIRNTYVK